jgi:hypothetical protein
MDNMQPEYETPHNGFMARFWGKVYNLMEKIFGKFEKPMKVVESAQRAKMDTYWMGLLLHTFQHASRTLSAHFPGHPMTAFQTIDCITEYLT